MKRLSCVVWALLIMMTPIVARAEVVAGGGTPVSTLVVGIIVEDPEPIGPQGPAWPDAPASSGVLSTNGGRPDVAFTPTDRAPVVVWAELQSMDHDIAFSEWIGGEWSATQYLTSDVAEELDPRIHRGQDGTLYVVWWRDDINDEIYLSSREAGQSWSVAERISLPFEAARRPSVVVVGDELWVSYERDSTQPGMAQELMLARSRQGVWTHELLAITASNWPLDAVLHERSGLIWLDWKHDTSAFGCLEYDGAAWSALHLEAWLDHSWVGEALMRKLLEQHVGTP